MKPMPSDPELLQVAARVIWFQKTRRNFEKPTPFFSLCYDFGDG